MPNLASAAWAIYSPSHTLLHHSGVCVGAATNNQAEYDAVIGHPRQMECQNAITVINHVQWWHSKGQNNEGN